MSEKKKARPAGGTAERAAETSTESSTFSTDDFSILTDARQELNVSDFLMKGENNAVPASLLAALAGFRSTRSLRLQIERERQAGTLILASDSGYYLPSECPEVAETEIRRFVRRTDARLRSNRRSIQGCKRVLRAMERGELEGQVSMKEGAGSV